MHEAGVRPDRPGRRLPGSPGTRARITFGVPDLDGMARDGIRAVDMHVHTRHSDAAPSVQQILEHARRRGIGVAITDHNEVSGVRSLGRCPPELLVVPGIELDCTEGPHILLYFYSDHDLLDFYDRHVRERRRGAQYMTSYLTTEEVLSAADGYACLRIAAHPFGYFGLDRGILKCINEGLIPDVMDRLDGIEAICGGMSLRMNAMAVDYAESSGIPVTGGSDAHLLREVGSVVTGVRADTVDEFLDGIRGGRSIVLGAPAGAVSRVMTGGVIGYNYIPYAATALRTRLGPHTTRLRNTVGHLFRSR